MRHFFIAMRLLAIGLLLGGCASKPYIDYDTGFAFAQLHSFTISSATADADPIQANRIQQAIVQLFLQQGFALAEQADAADFTVTFSSQAEQPQPAPKPSVAVGGAYGSGGHSGMGVSVGIPLGGAKVKRVITIDISAGNSDKLIWRGSKAFALANNPDRNANLTQQTVAAILAEFPPK